MILRVQQSNSLDMGELKALESGGKMSQTCQKYFDVYPTGLGVGDDCGLKQEICTLWGA